MVNNKDEYFEWFKKYYSRVGKYISLRKGNYITGNIRPKSCHIKQKEAIIYIRSIVDKDNLCERCYEDLMFFTQYYAPRIRLVKSNEDFVYDAERKYNKDKRKLAKLFIECEGDYLTGITNIIESISFRTKYNDILKFNVTDDNYKLVYQINTALYRLHLQLEAKDKEMAKYFKPPKKSSLRVQFVKGLYPMYQFLINELGGQPKESRVIISTLIAKLGYNLEDKISDSSTAEEYIKNIFKTIK